MNEVIIRGALPFESVSAADGTDTVAVGPDVDGSYRLHGYKWFTSATDAEMAFTLARLQDKGGVVVKVVDVTMQN